MSRSRSLHAVAKCDGNGGSCMLATLLIRFTIATRAGTERQIEALQDERESLCR